MYPITGRGVYKRIGIHSQKVNLEIKRVEQISQFLRFGRGEGDLEVEEPRESHQLPS